MTSFPLGPGTLYGEAKGLITPLPAQDRRPYDITTAGRAALTTQLEHNANIARIGLSRIGIQSG